MKTHLIRTVEIVVQNEKYCSWRCPCLIKAGPREYRCGANDEQLFISTKNSDNLMTRTRECLEEASEPKETP